MKSKLFLAALFFLSTSLHSQTDDVVFGTITIKIDEQQYELEHAKTFRQRARGLMFRQNLCETCGMLFTFSETRIGSIWMKNTFIPLDLAYVDSEGIITDIVPLEPHNLTPVKSSKPVAYAIEMNQGWFSKQGIKVGDRISLNEN